MENSTLSISRMIPGDRVFSLFTFSNDSNVDVKMRTIVECVSTDPEDLDFFSRLQFKLINDRMDNGTNVSNTLRYVSDWTYAEAGAEPLELALDIYLPLTETIQGTDCLLKFYVEAIQANAYTENEPPYLYYYSNDGEVSESASGLNNLEVVCKEDFITGNVAAENGNIYVGDNSLEAGDTLRFRVLFINGRPATVALQSNKYCCGTYEVSIISTKSGLAVTSTEEDISVTINVERYSAGSISRVITTDEGDNLSFTQNGNYVTVYLKGATSFTICGGYN